MTSRPGPGIRESLQPRGSNGQQWVHARQRPSQPTVAAGSHGQYHDYPELTQEGQRHAKEESVAPNRDQKNPVSRNTALEGASRPPPRGKPPLFFTPSSTSAAETVGPSSLAGALPLPPKPGPPRHREELHQQFAASETMTSTDVASSKVQSIEAPSSPPLYSGGKAADFFPWTGNHPEDTLSEALVKAGMSNKAQIMNEINTARPSVWPSLKNKSGLNTLSSLFVAVLEKRQSSGKITAANSFKPPPRLTLRDSTRETWLHDLANPTVGLRRLSRTIPHGITGTVLLDHCMNKNIPLARAVWLAKCVGINEMRSHKRKGQAGTLTWVRGWTISVEQFLEGVIASMGQDEWKRRITYALQVATCLFKEHLLEEGHFLDWILTNISASPPDKLFLWLMIVSVYAGSLSVSRRRGKHLAEALIKHADKLYMIQESQPSPLLEYLEQLLVKLLVARPCCFLLPRTWATASPVLRRLSSRYSVPQLTSKVDQLHRRVQRLLNEQRDTPRSQNSKQQVVSLLDSVDCLSAVDIENICSECVEVMPDGQLLVFTVLEWATSLFREGVYRVYLVARMLRNWFRLGIDIDSAILSFIQSSSTGAVCDSNCMFRIIAELVRSKTFSVGRYLQWLIATGALNSNDDIQHTAYWPLRLVTEIPLTGLPEQVRNLRSTLLQGTPFSADSEERDLDLAESELRRHLPKLCVGAASPEPSSGCNLLGFSSTIKLELSLFLRHHVAAAVETIGSGTTNQRLLDDQAVSAVTMHEFCVVRSYIEAFGDLSILADILKCLSITTDSIVLAAVVDTLLYHRRAFYAIGAYEALCARVVASYARMRMSQIPDRRLLLSLIDLAHTTKDTPPMLRALTNDIARLDQSQSDAACSPVSDMLFETVSNSYLETGEEIERILSSGTSMDQPTMSRVFYKIMDYLEAQFKRGEASSIHHAIWLKRTCGFDELAFERIVHAWLEAQLPQQHHWLLCAAVPVLVTSGCVTLKYFLESASVCIRKQQEKDSMLAFHLSMQILDIVLPSETLSPHLPWQDAYRYRLLQHVFQEDEPARLMDFMGSIIRNPLYLVPSLREQIEKVICGERTRSLVKRCACKQPQCLSALGIGQRGLPDPAWCILKESVDSLVDPSGHLSLSSKTRRHQVQSTIAAIDHLSQPFTQLEIAHLLCINDIDEDKSLDTAPEVLLEAIRSADDEVYTSCLHLISGLDPSLGTKLREHAEREILNGSSFLAQPGLSAENFTTNCRALDNRSLSIVNCTVPSTPSEGQPSIIGPLTERLKGVSEFIGNSGGLQTALGQDQLSTLFSWVIALLTLAADHAAPSLQNIPIQQQAAFVWSIGRLFAEPALSAHSRIPQFAYDVAMVLHDVISEDARVHLSKLHAAKTHEDLRCSFLFGGTASADGWVALVKPIPLPNTTPTVPSPQIPPTSASSPSPQQFQGASPLALNLTPPPQSFGQYNTQQPNPQLSNTGRMFPQYPQHPQRPPPDRLLTQLHQLGPTLTQKQQAQLQQMQRMQLQGLTQQQRNLQSHMQLQRQAASASPRPGMQTPTRTGGPATKQENVELRTFPFTLKPWELLAESGGNAIANDTAVSLSLFGARTL
ncbi:hypothetical protein M011DRAFT_463486 [Sporormia fimetaria CBS 119925]|uniref:Mediator of RNA polymerase II transcription subunit 12 n=1 Tax=Sporormia fimetaria CBS 119925 TaxID=1340428 RepID=A0A6A6VRV9_9PLEO|nr:hypothetical protein M011DRAFT_463486 [Sporormia fimetaria CBS 119925]